MKNRIFTLIIASVTCLVVFGACRKESGKNDEFERLPELPQDIAATLDPHTMATKAPASDPVPVKQSGIVLAPCCSISERMTLKVRYAYTKCGPHRDFIVAPLSGVSSLNLRSTGQSENVADIKAFKLTTFNGKPILDQQVCVTSQGPWNASFTEDRHCNNFTPQNTLIINAFGDVVPFVWSGGTPNHPPSVTLVSCRQINTSSAPCGISTCECVSSSCPASQPCNCNLVGW